MCKDAIQGQWHAAEIQRGDEQGSGSDLSAAARAEESSELLLLGPPVPRRLPLEYPEGVKLTLGADHLLDNVGTQRTDQLVFQVRVTHPEAELFHVGAAEVGAVPSLLEPVFEVVLLGGITEARQSEVEASRAEEVEESSDPL